MKCLSILSAALTTTTGFFIFLFLLIPSPALHAQGAQATPLPRTTTAVPVTGTVTTTTSATTTNALLTQGIQSYTEGELEAAFETLQSAQTTFADIGDRQREGVAWLYLGRVYAAQGEADKAREALEMSALIWEELTDYPHLLETLQAIGDLHFSNLAYEQAMTSYATARTLAQELGNGDAEAVITKQLAQTEFDRYHEQYQTDLATVEQAGDATKAAALLSKLGALYAGIDQLDEAIAAYEAELVIRRELQEPEKIADSLREIGRLYAEQEAFSEAATRYQEAAVLWQELNEREKAAALYNDLGVIQMKEENYTAAITAFEAELALRLLLEDQTKVAAVYNNLSAAHLALEDYAAAEQTLTTEVSLWQALDEPKKRRDTQLALAKLFDTQQAYGAAIEHYTIAISITRQLEDEKKLADLLTDLADDYVRIGELTEAVSPYEEALTIAQSLERKNDELKILRRMADLYRDLAAPTQAINYLTLALPLAAEENSSTVAKLYEDLGAAYRDSQAIERSLAAYNEALTIWQQLAEPKALMDTFKAIGDIYYREQQEYATALDYFTRALTIAQSEKLRKDEAYFLRRVGDSHEKQEAYDLALISYQESLAIWRELQDRGEQEKLNADIAKTEEELAEQQLALRTENGLVVPAEQEVVSGLIDVRGLATDPNFQKWQLDLLINQVPEQATFLEVSRRAAPAVKRLMKLDTTLYPNGTHILRLRVVRTDFNYDEYSVTITIAN